MQYAKKKYKFTEAAPTDREYLEQRECLKESLILQYKPEVLGEMQDIPAPDYTDEEAIKKYIEKMEVRREMIAELPDNIIPMDFHLYRVQVGDGMFEMGIDYFRMKALRINPHMEMSCGIRCGCLSGKFLFEK